MKDLYYSTKQQIAFWVAGFTDSSQLVMVIVETLQAHATQFQQSLPPYVKQTDIRTMIVKNNQSQFANQRIFWVGDIDECPAGYEQVDDMMSTLARKKEDV